ncbi:MAG: hypothetical protein CO129_06935 [Ignavibacteriales bacterium CG_4_9_14_3_um_filter_34_10]|nr:MAG: hypothetical protein CO129_06935 [Ignavibacteriales bacterium CG_4_9_14_3_um_filter_34_10]
MGQQQLWYILLGLIVVAIAVSLGIVLYREHAIDQKRNNVINDCVHLAAIAQQYYLKPREYGGGGKSFNHWEIPNVLVTNANGHYEITSIESQEVIILGTGNEVVTGDDSLKVEITIPSPPRNYQVTPYN